MSHTPGPWTLTHAGGSNFAVQAFDIRGMFDKTPNVYPIFNRGAGVIDGAYVFCSPADAKLVAAAPELLEALQALYREQVDYITINHLGDPHHNRSMQMARAAIKKGHHMNTKPKTHDCAGLVLTEDKKLLAYGLCVGVVVPEQELAKLKRDAAELRKREAA